jgi:hypothetical protein
MRSFRARPAVIQESAMGKPSLGGAQILLGILALVSTGLALLLSLVGNLLTFVTPPQDNPYLGFAPEVREHLGWIPAFGLVGLLLALGPLLLFARGHRRTRLLRELLKNTPGWTGIVALALILYTLITFFWFVSLIEPESNSAFQDVTRESAVQEMVGFRWDVRRLRVFSSGWMALYWPAILCAYQITTQRLRHERRR